MPLKFSEVCRLLSELERVTTRPRSFRQLEEESRRVIEYWFRCHRRAIDAGDVDGVALLSTLFPEKRTDRVYGLQETRLCKFIARCLRLNKARSKILHDWKVPGAGDLGECVAKLLKEYDVEQKPGAPLTVEEIDAALHELASRCHFSGPEIRSIVRPSSVDDCIGGILHRLKSDEAKWFVRLILKNFSPVEVNLHIVTTELHFLLPDLLRFQDSFSATIALLEGPLNKYDSKPGYENQKIYKSEAAALLAPEVGVKVGRQTFFKARSMQNCLDMCGDQKWSVERKYDGEYCEIHVDLSKGSDCIQIYSKSNKDSTQDRKAVHQTLRDCLRIGQPSCAFKNKCIVTGELVAWSDENRKILEFHHIRKHVSRSGVLLGAEQDSQIKPGERLMIVFFDILVLDDEILLRRTYEERRIRLKELLRCRVGHAITSKRIVVDFAKTKEAQQALCLQFAAALADRDEGLVLKPLDMPYFRFHDDGETSRRGYVIKLKKDYLAELGELRNAADFAVVGASYDSKLAAKSSIRGLKFTTFHLGCCTNKAAAIRFGEQPRFEIVGSISLEQCIPTPELQALNDYCYFKGSPLEHDGEPQRTTKTIDVVFQTGIDTRFTTLLDEPCVVEVLGSDYVKPPSKRHYMLRHPRVLKVHMDRSWQDACSLSELQHLAREAREAPETGVSQELSQLVAKLVGKFKRKEERDKGRSTSTEQTGTTISPARTSTTGASTGTPVVPSPNSGRRRSPAKNASPILIRVDTSERLPGEPELVASGSVKHQSDKEATDSLPTPPSTASPRTKRPTDGDVNNASRKRPRLERQTQRVEGSSTALTIINNNRGAQSRSVRFEDQAKVREMSFHQVKDNVHTSLGTNVSTQVFAGPPLLSCSNPSCPFTNTIVLLSPCISGMQWLIQDLLPFHGCEQTHSLAHWARETRPLCHDTTHSSSFQRNHGAGEAHAEQGENGNEAEEGEHDPLSPTVPESYSYPYAQKIILVESQRLEASMRCVNEVKSRQIRDLILLFDWRVLEDWRDREMRLEDSSDHDLVNNDPARDLNDTRASVDATRLWKEMVKEMLGRRYFGFTIWDPRKEEVVFVQKGGVAAMPTVWLDDNNAAAAAAAC